ncbi:hypothetical protein [Methylocella sp. CPCC 101449]|uniref:hypothetical protein n=1 Tax=Methylocella sp. CPCC 101449 TaxID=2987531 RepID=UPI00288D7972|nr:hypothetical protein [Methylocella sp. CPCC 101449]MDT2021823.1 nucleoside 2-deoxyribosyltransferase [Methylocella sp. CPCC 101449]
MFNEHAMGEEMNGVCPVCRNAHGTGCSEYQTTGDRSGFECEICGRFEITRSALISFFNASREELSLFQRATLSHQLSIADRSNGAVIVTQEWMERFVPNARLPNPLEQATNLIRIIGDYQSKTGEAIVIDSPKIMACAGAYDMQMFSQLRKELEDGNIIRKAGTTQLADANNPIQMRFRYPYILTLEGWTRYQAELRGHVAGRYGFIAMKFGDVVLDNFIAKVAKPAVQTGINFDLVDLRDIARAGVIDNILRQQIRDAAFVLVDLTHDNSGAYWEAGYAEGLGKPVIYLCERSKFDQAKTHFDTNHCTTVLWSIDQPDQFKSELVATLRRSLNLFATDKKAQPA